MDICYSVLKWIMRFYTFLFVDEICVDGLEEVPAGPKIIAANHPNTSNAMLLPLVFPDRLHFLISGPTFNMPVWGWLLKGARQIPVFAGKGKCALDEAEKALAMGNSVVILPEGRTTPFGQERRGGTGAVRLALKTQTPIVPVGFFIPPEMNRTLRLSKTNGAAEGYFQVGGPCYLKVGTPWLPGQAVDAAKRAAVRQLSDELMSHIRELATQAAQWRSA